MITRLNPTFRSAAFVLAAALLSSACGRNPSGEAHVAGPAQATGAGTTAGTQSPIGSATSGVTGGIPAVGGSTSGRASTSPAMAGATAGASAGVAGTTSPPPLTNASWMSFGADLAHSRANPAETLLGATTVAMLKLAWDIKAPGVTSTPAIANGIAYWGDWGGGIHATRLADGKELWSMAIPGMETGYVNSPALSSKWVYFANRNGTLTAHDRMTGEQRFMAKIDAGVMTYIWSSPVVVEQDNVLVIGVAGQGTRDNNVAIPQDMLQTLRGRVEGYDATTGVRLWQFETTPMPNGAGVSVWSSAAIDPVAKVAFIGTGNNYYKPVSPYSDSLLAIDYMTGKLKWNHQFTMNDAWTVATSGQGGIDGDVGATPNLFMAGERAAVGVGDKTGSYYVLDRTTGELIWQKKLTTGSSQGGVMAPAAVANGVIYVTSNAGARSTVFALDAKTGGDPRWTYDLPSQTFGGPAYANGVLYVGDQQGNMRALDVSNKQVLWMSRTLGSRGGGFAVANGMLLAGYGYHFSESRREPLMGGLWIMSTMGAGEAPTQGGPVDDCLDKPTGSTEPTFTNVYQNVICAAGCKLCHGDAATEAGLALTPKATAFAKIVNVAPASSDLCAGNAPLIAPSNPMGSLLYLKIAKMAPCGSIMPPGDPMNSPIKQDMLDLTRAWIMAGALNN